MFGSDPHRFGDLAPMIAQNGRMAMMVADAGGVAAAVSRRIAGEIPIAMPHIDAIAECRSVCTDELDLADLAHASVVCSTIARGRIVNIDAGGALLVNGVVSILTHQNLPEIVDDGCEVETIPPGSHFGLLRDDEIMFKGQPVALVVARTPEIARFAASLVRVEYERHAQVADVHQQGVAHAGDDDPMELGASTAIFESPFRISIRDTAGEQDLRQYFRSRLGSGLRPQFQAILAARAALALQCSVRVLLTLQQMRDLACAPRLTGRSR
jgi:xanthine dehydrogenase YagR molybdenum-binding subunit